MARDSNSALLESHEYEALIKISREGAISDAVRTSYPYDYFLRAGLVERYISDKFPFPDIVGISIPFNALRLTDAGQDALKAYRADKKAEYVSARRYWITTVIAILALILALISLLAQIGLIPLRPV